MRTLLLLLSAALLFAGKASAATIASVSFAPDTVTGGAPSTGTATLDGPAPAGGLTLTLASSDKSLVVPPTVSVPAGQNSITFPATTSTVTDQILATVTATAAGVAKTGSITINPVNLAAVTANPNIVLEGASSTVTISLNGPAPKGGVKIPLTCNVKEAPIPASVTIPEGKLDASFVVATKFVTNPAVATITATLGFVEATGTLTVNPNGPGTLSFTPQGVNGKANSTGVVVLYGAAPKGGMIVQLASSSRVATVPKTVTVPEGQTSVSFPITTVPVSILTPAQIRANYGNVAVSSTLNVLAPTIATTVLTPSTLAGGANATGTITLSFEAPPGGMVVAISSDMPSVVLPNSVPIPAGKTTVTFPIKTVPIPANKPANIKTQINGAGPTTPLTIQAPTMTTLILGPHKPTPKPPTTKTAPPATTPPAATAPPAPTPPAPYAVVTPLMTQGTVSINGPAPTESIDIAISSSDKTAVEVPAKVTIAGGRTSVTFKVRCNRVKAATTVTITATLNGASITAQLAASPEPAPAPSHSANQSKSGSPPSHAQK